MSQRKEGPSSDQRDRGKKNVGYAKAEASSEKTKNERKRESVLHVKIDPNISSFLVYI